MHFETLNPDSMLSYYANANCLEQQTSGGSRQTKPGQPNLFVPSRIV